MEWLKDKKNQPIVIGVAVFLLLVSGGFIAWQQGLFGGSTSDAQVTSAPPPPVSAPSGVPPSPTGGPAVPLAATMPGLPAAATTAAAAGTPAVKPASTDPSKGPDPFAVPGSQKKLDQAQKLFASSQVDNKPLLSAILPPMNLYALRPPTPPQAPTLTNSPYGNQGPNYRLSGIVNGSDGNINAILDLNGQTQTVKPGDALPDGSRVTTIQSTSVTLRTAGGTTISLPLSGGTPDPGTQPGQYNGPPGYNGPPPGFVPPGYNGPPPGFVPPGYNGPPPGFVPPGANNNVGD